MSDVLAGLTAMVCGQGSIAEGIITKLATSGAQVSCATDADAITLSDDAILDILIIDPLGDAAPASLDDVAGDDLVRVGDVCGATVRAMQAALPALKRCPEGRIILIGHRYGEDVAEGIGAYNAAAFSLVGLMRSAAVEWGRHGITANMLLPFAETPELGAARTQRERLIATMTGQVPLGRAGDPVEDVGGAAVFLASPNARFINGQVVHADGGQHVAGPVLNPARFARR